MVERESNTIILYPLPNDILNLVFTAIDGLHNDTGILSDTYIVRFFKKIYKNVSTGEEKVVSNNQINGAWNCAKDHFVRISDTNVR